MIRNLESPYRPGTPALSPREWDVLRWTIAGKTNWEIAVILRISERTVKFHLRNVMAKLDVTTRARAVAVALGSGLVPYDDLSDRTVSRAPADAENA